MNVKMDAVGRIVIPASVRNSLGLKKNSVIKMDYDETGTKIFFEKEVKEFKLEYVFEVIVNAIYNRFKYDCIITNRDNVLYTTPKYKHLKNNHISKEMSKELESSSFYMRRVFSLNICKNNSLNGNIYIFPIREDTVNKGMLIIDYSSKEYVSELFKFVDDIINNYN